MRQHCHWSDHLLPSASSQHNHQRLHQLAVSSSDIPLEICALKQVTPPPYLAQGSWHSALSVCKRNILNDHLEQGVTAQITLHNRKHPLHGTDNSPLCSHSWQGCCIAHHVLHASAVPATDIKCSICATHTVMSSIATCKQATKTIAVAPQQPILLDLSVTGNVSDMSHPE